jgi:hypothetical protein
MKKLTIVLESLLHSLINVTKNSGMTVKQRSVQVEVMHFMAEVNAR